MEKRLTESGAKALQRDDNDLKDRMRPFRDWHRTLDRSWTYLDADGIGWENANGHWVPAFVTELTMAENHVYVNDTYRKSIISRMFGRDPQGPIARTLSKLLNVPGFILLYMEDMSQMWAYDLHLNQWQSITKEQ